MCGSAGRRAHKGRGEGAKSAPRPQRRRFERWKWLADQRLGADPASPPVVLSTVSAYQYYETVGQNWERAALIKACPPADDLNLSGRFLADLAPFIWRKGIVTLPREERERTISGPHFHAAATTSRHVLIAAVRSARCD